MLTSLTVFTAGLHRQWLPAREIVQRALASATDGGGMAVLETFCPWESHLFGLEDELGVGGALK